MPELLVINKSDALGGGDDDTGEEARRLLEAHPGSVLMSARTEKVSRKLPATIGDRLRVGDRVVELEIPWARGDVLAAVHREGEIVGGMAGDEATRIGGGAARSGQGTIRRLPGILSPGAAVPGTPGGFAPPPYPYERLNGAKAMATERFAGRGGTRRLFDRYALRPTAHRRAGSDGHLGNRTWLPDVPGISGVPSRCCGLGSAGDSATKVDPDLQVAACVGTKKFVATTSTVPPPPCPLSYLPPFPPAAVRRSEVGTTAG